MRKNQRVEINGLNTRFCGYKYLVPKSTEPRRRPTKKKKNI